MNNDSNLDDVTGLSAFDDLDPVSVVSELAPTPEPPVGNGAHQGHVPQPQYGGAAAHWPGQNGGGHSLATQHFDLPGPDLPEDPDRTMQFSMEELAQATEVPDQYSDYESFGQDPARGPMQYAAHEPSVEVAADLAMDWDDDELETRLHHGVEHDGVGVVPPASTFTDPAAFAMHGQAVVPGGAPSPFPAAAPSAFAQPAFPPHAAVPAFGPGGQLGPAGQPGHVPPPPRAPGFHSGMPPAPTPAPMDTLVDEPVQENRWGARGALLLAVLFLGGGTILAAYNPFGGTEATITLATTPADAEVTLDGEPLAGQTSPYVLSVVANEEHALVVKKDGYEPFQMALKAKAGENRALPQIELKPVNSDMGFSIDSNPPGAKILVDGEDTGDVTPARVLGVEGGAHTVQLLSDAGHKPFEIQVFVPEGEVVDLPKAELDHSDGPGRGRREGTLAARRNRAGGGTVAARQPAALAERQARKQARAERQARRQQARAGRNGRQQQQARGARQARSQQARGAGGAQGSPFGTPKRASKGGGGTLRLNSRPWAQISVDGRPVGNTPQLNLKVPAGRHTIKFSNPQMGLAKTIKVRVRQNRTVTRVVNLIE